MKRVLLRSLIALVTVVILLVAAVWGLSEYRLERTWSITQNAIPLERTPEAIADGQHLVNSRGCTECHGQDLGGAVVIDDPAMGLIYAPNITTGAGSVVGEYSESDWVKAIRHGMSPDNRTLLLMPTEDYYFLDDRDVGHMIAYLDQLPAVDRPSKPSKVGPVARALVVAGKLPLLSAEKVDHTLERPDAPPREASVEYGEYLSKTCIGCHGESFAGGRIASGPPDWPPAANLTPHADGLSGWTEEQFFAAMRDGRSADGRELSEVMPRIFGNMTDEEIRALWLYVQSIPPHPDPS